MAKVVQRVEFRQRLRIRKLATGISYLLLLLGFFLGSISQAYAGGALLVAPTRVGFDERTGPLR